MIDHSTMRLGKKAAVRDARTLMLGMYTTADLPPAPEAQDWSGKLSHLGAMANDHLGDCTCAALGHLIQTWTSQAGDQVIMSDEEVIKLYENACGYNPADAATDQGGVELQVLKYWHNNPLVGTALDAFCSVEVADRGDVQDAIWLFGGVYIGLGLPLSAQRQEIWDVVPGDQSHNTAPFSWGGHAVVVIAYTPTELTCITWGTLKTMTWQFFNAYCDESYACLSKAWFLANGHTPSGFDWNALNADLASLTHR